MKINGFFNKVLRFINGCHLYSSKAEALFKFIIMAISWGGAFFFERTEIFTTEISAAFYFFSLSIITEYSVGLVTATSFCKKIIPFLLVLVHVFVLVVSVVLLTGKTINGLDYNTLFEITFWAIFVIGLDVSLTILIEPSADTYPENNLSNLKVIK